MASRGDTIILCTAGVANTTLQVWDGGEGVLTVESFSGTPTFDVSFDGSTFSALKDYVTGAAITPAGGYFPFKLPACARMRVSSSAGALTVKAVPIFSY